MVFLRRKIHLQPVRLLRRRTRPGKRLLHDHIRMQAPAHRTALSRCLQPGALGMVFVQGHRDGHFQAGDPAGRRGRHVLGDGRMRAAQVERETLQKPCEFFTAAADEARRGTSLE